MQALMDDKTPRTPSARRHRDVKGAFVDEAVVFVSRRLIGGREAVSALDTSSFDPWMGVDSTRIAEVATACKNDPDLDFKSLVFEHPVTGVSHVPRMLTLLSQHERRHQRQIDGIIGERKFPTSGSGA